MAISVMSQVAGLVVVLSIAGLCGACPWLSKSGNHHHLSRSLRSRAAKKEPPPSLQMPPSPNLAPSTPPPPQSSSTYPYPPPQAHALSADYYKTSCPAFYKLVPKLVAKYTPSIPTIPVRLIRLLLHDCMTHGCDASVMLLTINYTSPDDGSVQQVVSERDASDNMMFGGMTGGFPQILGIKEALEKACPGVVSCADVIVGAAYAGLADVAPSIAAQVPMRYGRLDSETSHDFDTSYYVPHQWQNPAQVRKVFSRVNLSDPEYVALMGTHTMGTANCWRFYERLKFGVDAKLFDPEYLQWLNATCVPEGGLWPWIDLDNVTATVFDNQYYKNVLNGRGLLATDARLVTDPSTLYWVKKYANNATLWAQVYAEAFIKLSEAQVLTGDFGEVRKDCQYVNANNRYINNPYPPSKF